MCFVTTSDFIPSINFSLCFSKKKYRIRLNSKNLIQFIIAMLQYLLPAALQHHLLARLQYLLQGCSTPCFSLVAPAMLQYCQHCRYRPFKASDILFWMGGWLGGRVAGKSEIKISKGQVLALA